METQSIRAKGDKFGDFTVVRTVDLPEIQCLFLELVHYPTGAKVIHLANDDDENVFCLSFQTVPDSSNGVAHILEHTVLCGSEKFPVKDPFFSMARRSLNTFMNALTGPDFTCYPAATQIPKDFYHLLEVYLDAVFHPSLNKLSFMQEGHRLEFADSSDPTSSLEYKGIVYNEMKGDLANPHSRLSEAFDNMMFPSLTYRFNSGGEPREIPQLTHRELVDFHRQFYHPSRCLFLFYGNMPLEGHLAFIEKHALQGVEKQDPLPPFPKQPRFDQAKRGVISYPFSEEQDPSEQSLVCLGWLTCPIQEQEDVLALHVLSIALLGTDAAPLKKALLRSGLCKQAICQIGDEYSEVPLTIRLLGCRSDCGEEVEKIVYQTLKAIADEGVPRHLIESAIHQVEFHRSEIVGDGYPFGLCLFMRAAPLIQHGGDPEYALLVHSLCRNLRKRMQEDPGSFAALIRRYLLGNPHCVRLTAVPDQELAAREREEESRRLETIRRQLKQQQVQEVIQQAEELQVFQQEQGKADLDILPKLELADIPKHSKDYPLMEEKLGNLNVFSHHCFTNDIIYVHLVFPLPKIEESELPLLSLFSLFMPQMGCGGRSYEENLDYLLANVGGVGAAQALNRQASDDRQISPYFFVYGKALGHKADKLFTLLHEMAASTDFTDASRLKEVITKHFTALRMSINQNALSYALSLSAGGLDMASRISQAWGGLEYYYAVKNFTENFDRLSHQLIDHLQSLQERILCLEDPHLVLSCDSKRYDRLKNQGFYGLQDIATKPYEPWSSDFTLPTIPSQGRIISSPVAFTARSFKTVPYTHPDSPSLSLADQLFDRLVLHPRIREQGGAYGGGAQHHALSGKFSFFSWRDPNIAETFAAFEEAIAETAANHFDESDLHEAKLEVIQNLDSPISPGSRGSTSYAWHREGKTPKIRQAFRDRLLGLTRKEVVEAIEQHIKPKYNTGASVVFAGKELLERENVLLEAQGKPALKIESI
ncbi:MAG: insulinase family protein [Waddliaceae bacterium]